jgi:hypothetical protein
MNELQDFDYMKFEHEKENLNDVFGTVLDTFPHITCATVTGQVNLWLILQKIKYNLVYDIDSETYLLPKYINGIKNTEYDQRKKHLPVTCYNARFNGYKNEAHIKSITNLMFMDIDDFPTREMAVEYKKSIIKKYDWIIACNLSLSKLGLHIIALVDKIYDNKDFNEKYDFISETYFNSRLDKSSKSLTRYTVVPFDYDIYINESPSVLNIDQIVNEHREGIRSAYIQDKGLTISSLTEKGISSAYNKDNHLNLLNSEKGILSEYNPLSNQIICTPYTFSSDSSLELIMNDAARKHNLRFRLDVDESNFKDPNIPIYIREGVDIIEVNTFKYKHRKVKEGHRHDFIGFYTIKMILLNTGSPDNNHTDIRRDILKFIQSLNKKFCEPPLMYDEVIKSYNANWKRYKEGKIDFTKYFKKQRSFWSKQSTLTPNEKRKVTCKIKNEPEVEDSKRRIWVAIEHLSAKGEKITQLKVVSISGLKLPTVKKYRHEYHEYKKMLNGKTDILEIEGNITSILKEPHVNTSNEDLMILKNANLNIENDYFELLDIDVTDFEEERTTHLIVSEETDSTPDYTEDQLKILYQRIFKSLHNILDESNKQWLYEQFLSCIPQFPANDAKLLITPPENISDSDDYWKQSTLVSKVWSLCTEKLPNQHF